MENQESNVKQTKLEYWKERFIRAKNAYNNELLEMADNMEAYEGTREIKNINTDNKAKKQGKIIRKVCFELVESQVDSNIPLPKVTSRNPGGENLSQMIEDMLKTEIDRIDTEELNDQQERITPVMGGAIFYLEWDNSIKTNHSIGDIILKVLDPKQVVPQEGVYDLDKMDYVFITFSQTKRYIKDKYGKDVKDEKVDTEQKINNDDIREHDFVYYRNENGEIGLFSWVGDTEVQDYENYFERKQKICSKCEIVTNSGDETCSNCGSKELKLSKKNTETITVDEPSMETVINTMTGLPETVPVMKSVEKEIPYYVLNQFPIIVRKNVSKLNRFLGSSDVEYIKDLQNEMAIYNLKIREKTLKGGSILVKDKDLQIKANDEELKIVDVDGVKGMDSVKIINIEANSTQDMLMQENDYQYSRQTIGITDSFQGRQDSTATSGKAKQFAAAQTAGRLNSKKTMKDFSFSKIYQLMFKFILAFADEPRTYLAQTDEGNIEYRTFDKYAFLKENNDGTYYYDDEFVFSTDISATLSQNRETMWQETRLNFTSGAYGSPNELTTLVMFWTIMDKLHYPGSKMALKQLTKRQKEQQMMLQQQMGNQQMIGGDLNVSNI